MSTKTTFKRIALVAVAALGFGTLAVVPASAELPADRNSVTAVSFGLTQQQGAASVARVGVATSFSVALSTGSAVAYAGGSTLQINTYVRFSALPADETVLGVGSNISPTLTAATLATGSVVSYGGAGATLTAVEASGVTPRYLAISTASAGAAIVGSQSGVVVGTAAFTPNRVGTYRVQGWVDNAAAGNTAGAADALERSATKTIVVGGTPTAIVVKALSSAAAVGAIAGTNDGHVYQVSLTDAAGNRTALIPGESVGVTLTAGTGGTVSDASLTADNFNVNGFAYVVISGSTADIASSTYRFAATGFTATSVFQSMTATAINAQASSVTFTQTTGLSAGSGFASTINTAQSTATSVTRAITFATGAAVTMRVTSGSSAAATSRVVGLNIQDDYGDIHGDDNSGLGLGGGTVNYSAAVAIDDTLGYGSITLPTASITVGDSLTVRIFGTDGSATSTIVLTAANVALDSTLSTLSPATANIVTGGGIELTAQCLDAFSRPVANCAVSWNVAALSRNATAVPTQRLADANGFSTFTLTDASTSTTVLTDTVSATMTFGSSTVTKTATITWGAANAVSAIAVTTSPTRTVATTESAISTAATGPEAGAVTLAFTVTDANGVGIAGVPVTFSANSTNVSWKSASTDVSNRRLAYTSSTGVATTFIAGWINGPVVVTATAGTKSVTTTVNFATVAANARTITLTAEGNIAKATVRDRFGNGVSGVTVSWSRTGAGYFGSGVSATTGTTDANGVTEILVVGEATVSAELSTTTYAQTIAEANKVGTTTTSGTGASLAPAGVAKATLAIAAATASAAAEAAADAAAEATDAANAATDAANAAAEAADAATAAAQDAADAVAALSTQVSEMVDALKKQITALTNLVIKIQKKVRA